MTYCLIVHILAILFRDIFARHFNPCYFGVATHDECETMVHGIWVMLDLHLNWVVLQVDVCNTFNSKSQSTIFQELLFFPDSLNHFFPCLTILCQLIPNVLFSSFSTWKFHRYCIKVGYMTKGPIGKTLVGFGSPLCFHLTLTTRPTYVFPSLANDTYILSPASNVDLFFLRLL